MAFSRRNVFVFALRIFSNFDPLPVAVYSILYYRAAGGGGSLFGCITAFATHCPSAFLASVRLLAPSPTSQPAPAPHIVGTGLRAPARQLLLTGQAR